ncbi:DNA replication complex subunit Gins51 [Haladaptatus sp. NG-SE-30]
MNLDELRSVQSKERSKDSLQHLRESFYADVGEYVRELREERERAAERASDPFDSAEVNRLTDEIQTAEEVVEAIYERRVGKVVKRASLAAAGIPADEEGLTNEEQTLFADLVERIEANKSTVLDVLAGAESDAQSSPDEPTTDESATEKPSTEESRTTEDDHLAAEAAAVAGDTEVDETGSQEPPAAPESNSAESQEPPESSPDLEPDDSSETPEPVISDERTMVRITRDVGEIFGVDEREYDLASEDVVTLPTENAAPLIERDAAEKLE